MNESTRLQQTRQYLSILTCKEREDLLVDIISLCATTSSRVAGRYFSTQGKLSSDNSFANPNSPPSLPLPLSILAVVLVVESCIVISEAWVMFRVLSSEVKWRLTNSSLPFSFPTPSLLLNGESQLGSNRFLTPTYPFTLWEITPPSLLRLTLFIPLSPRSILLLLFYKTTPFRHSLHSRERSCVPLESTSRLRCSSSNKWGRRRNRNFKCTLHSFPRWSFTPTLVGCELLSSNLYSS